MIKAAASYLPESERDKALRVIVFSAAGMSVTEIAREIGTTTKGVASLRDQMGQGFVRLLRADGYSDGEICRTLGIATTVLESRYST